MSNLAEQTMKTLSNYFDGKWSGGDVAVSVSDLHDPLTDACNSVTEICDQETWVFSDGSYITRQSDGDTFWTGDDVTEFELVESMDYNQ